MFRKILLAAAILGLAAAPAYAGDAAKGKELYDKNCKACHQDGSKSVMSKAIKPSSKEVVIAAIEGKSQGLSNKYPLMVKTIEKKPLTAEDKDNIAAYLAQ